MRAADISQPKLFVTLYTLRSKRQRVEHIQYNMLYRWFVGLELDDRVWHATPFSKNRDRLLGNEVFTRFFESESGQYLTALFRDASLNLFRNISIEVADHIGQNFKVNNAL